MGIEDLARRVGQAIWIETALFEVVGQWVPSVSEPALKSLLAAHSEQHAWHADLWRDRLPALAQLSAADVTVPADDAIVALVTTLSEVTETLDRLVGAYRVVLPRLVVTYENWLAVTDRSTDAPTVRALTLVLADEAAAWRAGEAAVQTLITDADRAGRAATAQQTYESLIAGAAIV